MDSLPNGEPVRPNDHAALDYARRLGELGFLDHILIPLRVVIGARRDARFGHGLVVFRAVFLAGHRFAPPVEVVP